MSSKKNFKNTPAGGTTLSDKGTTNNAKKGGYFKGKRHKDEGGGIMATVEDTGQQILVESDEVIITRNAVLDGTKREFEGEMLTNKQILSRINQSGGGVAFAGDAHVPREIHVTGRAYKYGGKTMTDHQIVQACGCSHKYGDEYEVTEHFKKRFQTGGAVGKPLTFGEFSEANKNLWSRKDEDGRTEYSLAVNHNGQSKDFYSYASNAHTAGREIYKQYAAWVESGEALHSEVAKDEMLTYDAAMLATLQAEAAKDADAFATYWKDMLNRIIDRDEVGKLSTFLVDLRIKNLIAPDVQKKLLAIKSYNPEEIGGVGRLKLSDISPLLKKYIPDFEQRAMVGSEEHWDLLRDLEAQIKSLPNIYESSRQKSDERMVLMHYFHGGSDWWITGKGEGEEDDLVFGFCIRNNDYQMAEWGDSSVEYIKSLKLVELDLYWTPAPWSEVKKTFEARYGYGSDEDTTLFGTADGGDDEDLAEAIAVGQAHQMHDTDVADGKGNFIVTSTPGLNDAGRFFYGEAYRVPQPHSDALKTELKHLGYTLLAETKDTLTIENYYKHPLVIRDNGGEFRLVNLRENSLAGYVPYYDRKTLVDSFTLAGHISKVYVTTFTTIAVPEDEPQFKNGDAVTIVGNDGWNGESATVTNPRVNVDHETVYVNEGGVQVKKSITHTMVGVSFSDGNRKTFRARDLKMLPLANGNPVSRFNAWRETIPYEASGLRIAANLIGGEDLQKLKDNLSRGRCTPADVTEAARQATAVGLQLTPGIIDLLNNISTPAEQSHDPKRFSFMQTPCTLVASYLDADQVSHELYAGDDGSGILRVYDLESENVVGIVKHKSFSKAEAEYDKSVKQLSNLATKQTAPAPVESEAIEEINNDPDMPESAKAAHRQQAQKEIDLLESHRAQQKSLCEVYKNSKQAVVNDVIRKLTKEKGRNPDAYSPDEKAFLKRFEGAGGLAKQGETGLGLLDQFFTPLDICRKMWGLAIKYGFQFNNSRFLEPAVGTGRFLSLVPEGAAVTGDAYDVDETCATICAVLYPQFNVHHASFETMFFRGKQHQGLAAVATLYDLVIGNPPYREYDSTWAPLGEAKATGAYTFDQYFIMRGVDVLKPGGLLVFIVPSTFLANGEKYNGFKTVLANKCDLIDAYRLPNGLFPNTDVGTDIIVLKKHAQPALVETKKAFASGGDLLPGKNSAMSWEQGFDNTKTFQVSGFLTNNYLQGCKTCDTITRPEGAFQHRQQIGNVYQSLCRCSRCGGPLVLDEHKLNLIDTFLNDPAKYKIV